MPPPDLHLLPERAQARREDGQELCREDEAGECLQWHTRRAAGTDRLFPQLAAWVIAGEIAARGLPGRALHSCLVLV